MQDLIVMSDKPIFKKEIENLIINKFSHLNILNNSDQYLYLKNKRVGFEIEFSPSDVLNDPECCMEELVDKCPNKKAYLTNISFTSLTIAKRLIELIEPLFGNMWIVLTDSNVEFFGTAKDFIKL